jgi:hypothetical protein
MRAAPRQRTERQRAAEIEEGADTDAPAALETGRRIMHTKLLFWRVCTLKACKRARGCRGDVDACWQRWRGAIPDGLMMRLRLAISARVAGLSVEEALRAADAQVARITRTAARVAQDHAQPAPAPKAQPSPPPSPRARLV